MVFGRRKKSAGQGPEGADAAATDEVVGPGTGAGAGSADDATAQGDPATGPFDESQVDGPDGRVDFGGIWLRAVPGMEVRLEVDPRTDVVSAVQISLAEATAQLQAFAAPRSSGIWDEIRGEIATMIQTNRGTVEEGAGRFGTELRTRLPQPGPEGRTVFAPAVFAGVDGPRWLLRVVYSGQAAVDPQAREALDAVIEQTVVVRGKDPMAPREMLPLTMPEQPAS